MLIDLRVKNFALIEKLEISFQEGLNVLTGETGAGKSIIIGALEMLLGGRASRDVIRQGKEKAYIEAVYEPSNLKIINNILENKGIEPEPDILLLSREIKESGRNRSRINGQLATLSMVREISGFLVDIHGQHEHQSLLDEKEHILFLDDYIGDKITGIKDSITTDYNIIKELKDRIAGLEIDEGKKARELDLLEFQIDEIKEADLKLGEYEDLNNRFKKLSNIEDIYSTTGMIHNKINEEDYNTESILDEIGDFMNKLDAIKDYDEALVDFYKQIKNIYYQLQDLGFQLRGYHEKIDFDDDELVRTEQRLNQINGLQKKYGKSIEEILAYKDNLVKKRDELLEQDQLINKLNKKINNIEEEYYQKAKKLTKKRKKFAKKLEEQLRIELNELAMEDITFKVDFIEKNPSKDGIDDIKFLISPNPGEDLKPLSKIASGGELSRIMLAFKTIIADIDKVDTLIFDEVDSGVGGKTAQKMAEKLAVIANKRQVICITHLPQIASMSDDHFFITKSTADRHTYTSIFKLDEKGEKEELARMLGGVKLTATTLQHAEEMLEMAAKKKENL
jgi:DNA repair protein RecN (Recombination protein N)